MKKGLLGNIKDAFLAFASGVVLFLVATCLLYGNEENYFNDMQFIKSVDGSVVDVTGRVSPEGGDSPESSLGADFSDLDGAAVYASADASVGGPVVDPATGVSCDCLVLKRCVSYYQWKETSHTETDSDGNERRVYSYSKAWTSDPVDSSRFRESGHENSVILRLPDLRFEADDAKMGVARLSKKAIALLDPSEEKDPGLSSGRLDSLAGSLAVSKSKVHASGRFLYFGVDPDRPRIGDVRVLYKFFPCSRYSFICQFKGSELCPLDNHGKPFFRIERGEVTKDDLISHARSDAKWSLWGFRIFYMLLVFAACCMILSPICRITEPIPIVGGVVRLGVTLAALAVSIPWSLVVIAFSWFRFRPMAAALILFAALAIYAVVSNLSGRGKGRRAASGC